MEGTSFGDRQRCGKLVAFEGDVDTVSAQLRLLPSSPKILVLQSFMDDLWRDHQNEPFDVHAFIRKAHDNFMERLETARSFLRDSTAAQPRLVFMNGGCVRARKICISKISENLTHGDTGEAENLFNNITRHGAARLLMAESDISEVDPDPDMNSEEETTEILEDPSIRAVKAAELLYYETAALQAEDIGLQEDLFDSLDSRSRGSYTMGIRKSMRGTPEVRLEPLAAYDVAQAKDQELLTTRREGAEKSILAIPSHYSVAEGRNFPLRRSLTARSSYTTVPMYQVEENGGRDYDENHWDESRMSIPPTPVVVYGQAFLVDVQTTSPGKLPRRTRSLDRFFPSKSRCRETVYGVRPASSIALGGMGLQTLPRKSFLKASETTIKKLPTSTRSTSSAEGNREIKSRRFVDRGTDTVDIPIAIQESAFEEFVPIFPLMEDLIISFNDGQPNGLSDFIIRFYKNGRYPAMPSLFWPDSFGHIPASDLEHLDIVNSPVPSLSTEKDGSGYESRPSHDLYCSDDSYSASTERPWPPREKLFGADSCIRRPNSQTRPPESVAERFIELPLSTTSSILEIHNSLRQLLSVHLPAGENGYSQHYFSVPPEAVRIWKPVFGNDPLPGTGNETANIDQIIALGCESGVTEEFCDQICWNIEQLATKNGFNRSAKLDLGYLIAMAMQTSSALSRYVESTSNPLSEPSDLAALLVPQLEAYLATNKNARLLILKYPPEHLPAMIELRKTLGNDLFKIAGILNSLESDPQYIPYRPPPLISNNKVRPVNHLPSSTYHTTSLNALLAYNQKNSSLSNSSNTVSSPKRPSASISFAKANYVLPSSAVENEVASFISEIRKSLVEKSPLYESEPHSKPLMVEIGVQIPPIPPIPKTSPRRKTPTTPTGTQSTRGSTQNYDQDRDSLYPASSFKSPTIRREREARKKWDNFYVGEEDSDDDEFDKMIMGRKHAKILPEVRVAGPIPPKKNMQKALKWLGVAE